MKITKRIVSLLAAVSMLPVMIVQASAQEAKYYGSAAFKPDGWTIQYNNRNMLWNKDQDYAGVAVGQGVADAEGNKTNALCINIESAPEANKYISPISNFSAKLAAGSSYRVSFWLKGEGVNFQTAFDWSERKNFTTDYKAVETKDGWTKYSVDVENVAAERSYLRFIFEGKMNYVIDNVEVYEILEGEITGDNLVTASGFEEYASVYNFDISDEKGDYKLNSWAVGYHGHNITDGDTNANKHYNFAQPTAKYARTGNYALYIKYNGEITPNTYFQINCNNKVNIEEGNYKVRFWAKINTINTTTVPETDTTNKYPTIGLDWYNRTNGSNLSQYATGNVDENGWVEYEIDYTYAATDAKFGDGKNKLFNILVEDKNELVIDDMEYFKVGAEDTNLFVDGGFENVTPVAAENKYTFGAWSVKQNMRDNPTSNVGGEMYIEPSDAYSVSGKSAHFAYNMETKAHAWMSLGIPVSMSSDKTYTISMKVKKVNTTNCVKIATNWASSNYQINEKVGDSGWTSQALDDGWVQYTKDFTLSADKHTVSTLNFYVAEKMDVYIDDLSVVEKDGDGTNLISDGGFENVTSINQNVTTLMGYPANAGKALNISWFNPASYRIAGYKVYVDGKECANEPVSTKPSAFNEMYIDGLTNGQKYEIKLVEKVAGGEREYITYATPDNAGNNVNMDEWTFNRFNIKNSENYPIHSNVIASFDNNVKASGNTSMRIDANIPTVVPNFYPHIYQNTTVTAENKHQLSLKAKFNDINNFTAVMKYQQFDENNNLIHDSWLTMPIVNSNTAVTKDWTEYTFEISDNIKCNMKHDGTNVCGEEFYIPDDLDGIQYKAILFLMVERGAGSVWVDDIELRALDYSTGKPFGDNLIEKGGFEYTYSVLEPEYALVSGETTTAITNLQAGTVEVTARIKNYGVKNGSAAVVAALYDGNKLINVNFMEKELDIEPVSLPAEEFTVNLVVPELSEGTDYKIKTMYWDGMGTMIPLDVADILVPAAK